jgi:preprotein translocase subunit SecG
MASFLAWTSQVVLALLGLFLIIVVLLQRGRGGGLAGAFGGMGGQSAFGTKAGDVFTKITIGIAILWVIVAGGSGFLLRAAAEQAGSQFGAGAPAGATLDPPIPEGKPAADSVPQPPTPPTGTSVESPDSQSATPAASEPATTPAEPAAAPTATETETPAPTDGAANPEPQ